MRWVLLHGTDHSDLGADATSPCGPRCAVGLTRGRQPKPYAHLDPNEDIAAARELPGGVALVVADGHNGIEAAHAASTHVLAALDEQPTSLKRTAAELVALLTAAGQAAWEATRTHPYPRRGSRTALGIVLADGPRVQWAVIGDVAVITGGTGAPRVLNTLDEVFLGGPSEERHIAELSDIGTVALQPGEWLVLASDGLLNFAPLAAVDALLSSGGQPEEVAGGLLRLAGDHGAGDNVAVAVLAPIKPATDGLPGAR